MISYQVYPHSIIGHESSEKSWRSIITLEADRMCIFVRDKNGGCPWYLDIGPLEDDYSEVFSWLPLRHKHRVCTLEEYINDS